MHLGRHEQLESAAFAGNRIRGPLQVSRHHDLAADLAGLLDAVPVILSAAAALAIAKAGLCSELLPIGPPPPRWGGRHQRLLQQNLATSGLMQCSKQHLYLIASSAWASNVAGTSRP